MQITFFCEFLSPNPLGHIRLGDSAELTVSDLRTAVYKRYEIWFKRTNVGVSELVVFASVRSIFRLKKALEPTPLASTPYGTLADRAIGVWNKDNRISNMTLLSKHPEWQDMDQVSLFLRVCKIGGHQVKTGESRDQAVDLDFVDKRVKYFELNPPKAPSSEGQPSAFGSRQEHSDKVIYCGRPSHTVQAVPPTLLCPELSQFVVDLDSCTPSTSDIECFHKLSQLMPEMFDDEVARMMMFREILNAHDFDIRPRTTGKYASDWGKRALINKTGRYATYLVVEGKSEIGGEEGADPMFQAILYWMDSVRELALNLSKSCQDHTNFPVVLLQHYGSYISVAVGVFAESPNVQLLNPIIPLHFHPTDHMARDTGERFICALRRLLSNLEKYYLTSAFSQPRSDSQPQFPFYSTYTVEGVSHRFVYEKQLPEKRVFVAHLKDNQKDKIYVKFTRRYGEDAHRVAFELGFAPKLRAVERFGGGWVMVVMDDISAHYDALLDLQPTKVLRDTVGRALEALHEKGFVHGDVRNSNIMIKRDTVDDSPDKVLFVDFDWAGRAESVKYPSNITMPSEGLWRPVGVERGGLINAAHDKEMLKIMFGNIPSSTE